LVHRFTLFPGHFVLTSHQLFAYPSVTYVLNLLCYPCSEPVPQGIGSPACPLFLIDFKSIPFACLGVPLREATGSRGQLGDLTLPGLAP